MIKNIAANPSFKYHYGGKELKLTHMCFVDDLMVLCNGNKASLEVVKQAIEEVFGSITEDRKKELLKVLPFKHGKLPMKYLKVPLISMKLSLADCKSLIENVETRINNWKALVLCWQSTIDSLSAMWPREWLSLYPVLSQVDVPNFNQNKDTVWWINDCHKEVKYSVSAAWISLRDKWPDVNWRHMVWFSQCTPKHAFILCLNMTVERLTAMRLKSNIWQIVNTLILSATIYNVWMERNKRIFKNEVRSNDELVSTIKKHVTDMLMSLKVKSSGALVMVAKIWGLNLVNRRLIVKGAAILIAGPMVCYGSDLCSDMGSIRDFASISMRIELAEILFFVIRVMSF
ncbi:hypothetical protein Tco_0572807 [Tanacetum coccineum]